MNSDLNPSLHPHTHTPTNTTYRNLAVGETNRCYIELDTPTLSTDKMENIEGICNELIRQGVPVTPRWYSAADPKLDAVSVNGYYHPGV